MVRTSIVKLLSFITDAIAYVLIISVSIPLHAEQTIFSSEEFTQELLGVSPSLSKITGVPHAPSQITRNIKLNIAGNLLIASNDDIIENDGKIFNKFEKAEGLHGYDAFDVLEDKQGHIWIASRYQGVFYYVTVQSKPLLKS